MSELEEWQRIIKALARYEQAPEDEIESEEHERLLDRYHELKTKNGFTPLDMPGEDDE